MFKFKHHSLIALSGVIWLAIGCLLFSLGLDFTVKSILEENINTLSRPLLDNIAYLFGGIDQAILILIFFSLVIGWLKGHYVFKKTVIKGVQRIQTLPNPAPLSQIYTKSYYFLLAGMGLLGFLIRFVPMDVRGAIDMIIGVALIYGAFLYFRSAYHIFCVCKVRHTE